MGLSLDDVIKQSTWNPAREIKQEQLGHLSVGAGADVAVLAWRTAASDSWIRSEGACARSRSSSAR
jgi:predicted amidohydrolase